MLWKKILAYLFIAIMLVIILTIVAPFIMIPLLIFIIGVIVHLLSYILPSSYHYEMRNGSEENVTYLKIDGNDTLNVGFSGSTSKKTKDNKLEMTLRVSVYMYYKGRTKNRFKDDNIIYSYSIIDKENNETIYSITDANASTDREYNLKFDFKNYDVNLTCYFYDSPNVVYEFNFPLEASRIEDMNEILVRILGMIPGW